MHLKICVKEVISEENCNKSIRFKPQSPSSETSALWLMEIMCYEQGGLMTVFYVPLTPRGHESTHEDAFENSQKKFKEEGCDL